MTFDRLANVLPTLARYADKEMPMKYSYALHKIKAAFMADLEFYEQTRNGIFVKYGKESETTPGNYAILPENIDAAKRELDELHGQEVATVFEKIPVPLIEGFHMSPNDMDALAPFIEFVDE